MAFLQEVGQSLTTIRLKNELKCSAFMITRLRDPLLLQVV